MIDEEKKKMIIELLKDDESAIFIMQYILSTQCNKIGINYPGSIYDYLLTLQGIHNLK